MNPIIDAPDPGPALQPASKWKGAVTLLALTFLAFAPAIAAQFIWDDPDHILNNTTLRDLHGLFRMWTDRTSLPQWYPLTHTTFWIEYHLWGTHPLGYHIDNLLLHALSCVLLWRLLKTLELPGAFLAAAMFATHPALVETVAWVTERKNTLSLVFYLLAAHAYLPIALQRGRANGRRWYIIAFALFVAALLSKSVTSTFPAAMLLIIGWKLGRIAGRDVVRLVPFFIVSLLAGWNTGYLERTHVIHFDIAELHFTPLQRVMIAGRAICFYAGKLLVPHDLTFIYPRWTSIDAAAMSNLLFAALVVAVLTILFALRKKLGRGPLVAALFFCGTLVPALGFVSVYPMRFSFVADHFQYHASIGLIALFAAMIALLSRRAFTSISIATVLVLVGLSLQRSADFHDALTLWTDTREKNPNSWLVDTNLGHALHQAGNDAAAGEMYLEALRLNPAWFETHLNAANVYGMRGDLDRAVAELRAAARLNPDYTDIFLDIANVEQQRHQLAAAEEAYRFAIQKNPHNLKASSDFGLLLMSMKRFDESIRYLSDVAIAMPNEAGAWLNLGGAQLAAGKHDDAIASFRKAIAIDPNLPQSRAAQLIVNGQR